MVHVIVVLGCSRNLEYNLENNSEYNSEHNSEHNLEYRNEPKKNQKQWIITETSHLFYRLKKAANVYFNLNHDHKILVCSGGNNEAPFMKEFLMKEGVPASRIYMEPYSRTTIENCIFTYRELEKWIKSEPTFDQLNGFKYESNYEFGEDENRDTNFVDCSHIDVHVVTNEYHIERAVRIFNFFTNRFWIPVKVTGYAAPIPNDLEDTTKYKIQERNIINNTLINSLNKVKDWYPTSNDYILRSN